jgi:hypothetical protein
MRLRRVANSCALVSCLMVLANGARSEEGPSSLAPGQRLRLTAVAPGPFTGVTVGTLGRIGPDSLTLIGTDIGGAIDLPKSSITRIEVSHRRRHTRQGLLLGAAVGIAAGAALASGYSEVGCGPSGGPYANCSYSNGEKAGYVAAGVLVWGSIGAWLGHRIQSDHWSDLPLERLRLSLRPERHGLRAALAISF